MKRLGVIIIGVLMIANVNAQRIISLWPQGAPDARKHSVVEEKTVSEWGGAKIMSGISEPELWHYDAKDKQLQPAVIICPGGGYRVEAYEHEGTLVAQWLNTLGIQAFVLKYRLPDARICDNPVIAPLTDIQRAMQLLHENASGWNIDATRIGVMGFSAGGHLAASASNLFQQSLLSSGDNTRLRPDFSILIYPVISMEDSLTHMGSREALLGNEPSAELINQFSMEKQVSAQTPKTFILHAQDDQAVSVDNTNVYAAALREKGVAVTKVILPAGGHGFGYNPDSSTFKWTTELKTWLEENVLKKK